MDTNDPEEYYQIMKKRKDLTAPAHILPRKYPLKSIDHIHEQRSMILNSSPGAEDIPGLLLKEAVRFFAPSCLWNITPTKDRAGLSIVSERLKQYGDMKAFRLAIRIDQHLKDRP